MKQRPIWTPSKPWAHEKAPHRVRRVPTMLKPGEAKFLQWLARTETQGDGAVVDLGAFVGGSSACLAEGLRRAGSPALLHVYDRFRVSETLKRRMLYPAGVAPFDGDCMEMLARNFLAPWRDRIRLHPGRIERIGWAGGPIQLLFVDAFKRAATTDAMVADFFPHLAPGRSIVVHQDFLHPAQPWIVALMHALKDAFDPLGHIGSTTVAFRCKRRITPSLLRRARVAALTDDQLLDAVAHTRRRYGGWGIGHRLARMEATIHASPRCRIAHRMTRPPESDRAAIKAA